MIESETSYSLVQVIATIEWTQSQRGEVSSWSRLCVMAWCCLVTLLSCNLAVYPGVYTACLKVREYYPSWMGAWKTPENSVQNNAIWGCFSNDVAFELKQFGTLWKSLEQLWVGMFLMWSIILLKLVKCMHCICVSDIYMYVKANCDANSPEQTDYDRCCLHVTGWAVRVNAVRCTSVKSVDWRSSWRVETESWLNWTLSWNVFNNRSLSSTTAIRLFSNKHNSLNVSCKLT